MKLYHTGFTIIDKPDVHYGRANADFGQGFYVTDDYEFACRWAKERRNMIPIVNEYECDFTGLKVHEFERTHEWFNYIFRNRRFKPDEIDADVIIGPIANDTIYDTMGIITSGLIPDDDALRLLLIGPEYHQIVLKSDEAGRRLQWLDSHTIPPDDFAKYREIVRREEEAYLKEIGVEMEKMF